MNSVKLRLFETFAGFVFPMCLRKTLWRNYKTGLRDGDKSNFKETYRKRNKLGQRKG